MRAARTCGAVRPSGKGTSTTYRLERSTSVPIADLPPFPMSRSPSQCPGIARSSASLGRSLMRTMSRSRPVPECSLRYASDAASAGSADTPSVLGGARHGPAQTACGRWFRARRAWSDRQDSHRRGARRSAAETTARTAGAPLRVASDCGGPISLALGGGPAARQTSRRGTRDRPCARHSAPPRVRAWRRRAPTARLFGAANPRPPARVTQVAGENRFIVGQRGLLRRNLTGTVDRPRCMAFVGQVAQRCARPTD